MASVFFDFLALQAQGHRAETGVKSVGRYREHSFISRVFVELAALRIFGHHQFVIHAFRGHEHQRVIEDVFVRQNIFFSAMISGCLRQREENRCRAPSMLSASRRYASSGNFESTQSRRSPLCTTASTIAPVESKRCCTSYALCGSASCSNLSRATSPRVPRVLAPPRTLCSACADCDISRPACCTSPSCWLIRRMVSFEVCICWAMAICASLASLPEEATPVSSSWRTWPSCVVTV